MAKIPQQQVDNHEGFVRGWNPKYPDGRNFKRGCGNCTVCGRFGSFLGKAQETAESVSSYAMDEAMTAVEFLQIHIDLSTETLSHY